MGRETAGEDFGEAMHVSATDVWAVGFSETSEIEQTLTLHWDGTSWSVVSSPAAGRLRGIAIVSATDIWALGVSWIPTPEPRRR